VKAVKGVHLQGLEDVQRALEVVTPRESKNILRRTTLRVAQQVRDQVKEKTPVKTGNLKRAIKAKRGRGDRTAVTATVVADRSGGRSGKAYHWHLLEFGTVKMPAQPFISPTVEGMRGEVPGIYRREFGNELEKEMQKRAKKAKK